MSSLFSSENLQRDEIRLKYRIIDFMNILEVIAISIENDTLDYDTINDMYSNIFEEYWVQMAPYVSALRASDLDECYDKLEKLLKRMRSEI